jgi:hypothetical protein
MSGRKTLADDLSDETNLEFQKAQDELSGFITIAGSCEVPQLKANENFLSSPRKRGRNRIAVERKKFNETVQNITPDTEFSNADYCEDIRFKRETIF